MRQQRFVVDGEMFARLPGMRIVAVSAGGLDNSAPHPAIDRALDEAWADAHGLAAGLPNPQSHPHVAGWREALKTLGVSVRDHPSSIEAMLRRAFKVDEPFRINPLTDLIHTVSLRYLVPVGGFDLDQIDGDLELRATRHGEQFVPLDGAEPVPVAAGEVAYADASTVHTRHFVWRQARKSLIDVGTRRAVLVAEVLPELDPKIVDRVVTDFSDGLAQHFSVDPSVCVIDAKQLTTTLPS